MRLLVSVAAVVLCGCSGGSPAPAVEPAPVLSAEDAYIAELGESLPAYAVEPEREAWLERGWDACVAITEDGLPEDALVMAWANMQGVDREDAAVGLDAAKAHLCES